MRRGDGIMMMGGVIIGPLGMCLKKCLNYSSTFSETGGPEPMGCFRAYLSPGTRLARPKGTAVSCQALKITPLVRNSQNWRKGDVKCGVYCACLLNCDHWNYLF